MPDMGATLRRYRVTEGVGPTYTYTIKGQAKVAALAMILLTRSAYFAVMPLPDDWWDVTVRVEFDMPRLFVEVR